MNISENINIIGMEKTGCSFGHIAHCLNHSAEPPKFDYFGPRVRRGTVAIHTKNGDFTMKFREAHGWISDAEIL